MATEKQSVITSSIDAFTDLIEKHGRAMMEKAVEQVLDSNYKSGVVSSASKYHVKFLRDVLPTVPALMTLSCEVAGGKKEKPIGIGAALTLFVEAANIHDDIIDQTIIKHKRKTTFGKFGTDITLLAGDFLLVQAALSLFEECESLPSEQKNKIIELTFQALSKISKSAAEETKMRRKIDTLPQDYLQIVRLRAAVPEIHCMIGGILGGGTKSMISCLGNYGRNYGIVGTIIDEFMDLFDYQKFSNRLCNECIPLPVLCALQNTTIKEKIAPIIKGFTLSKNDYSQIVKLVMNSNEVEKLRKDLLLLPLNSNLQIIKNFKENTARRDLSTILKVLEGLLSNLNEFTNQTI